MNDLLRKSAKILKRETPTILTCIGGVGVIATTVVAVKATPKALILLKKAEKEKGEVLTKMEKIKVATPVYIPTMLLGASTIACIFGANILNKRSQASLMSAYALVNDSYKQYKEKVVDLYGEEGEEQVRDEIAKDEYKKIDIETKEEQCLFYDEYSKRYFNSTLLAVQRAEYDLNRDLVMMDCVTLNDFYDYLKIDHIEGGDKIGWSTGMNFDFYWQSWIDFSHRKRIMDDGRECYILTIFHEPSVDFEEYY